MQRHLLILASLLAPAAALAERAVCLTDFPRAKVAAERASRMWSVDDPVPMPAPRFATLDRGEVTLISGDCPNATTDCVMRFNTDYQCYDVVGDYDYMFAATRRFYAQHSDLAEGPDVIVFWTTFSNCFSGGAFYFPIANETRGINIDSGGQIFDYNRAFNTGSRGRLRGVVLMSDWYCREGSLCSPQTTFDASFDSVHGTLGQELGHRWGSFVRFKESSSGGVACGDGSYGCSQALLGRSYQHWSYYLDSDGSPLEGNDWIEGSPGSFTLIPAAVTRFSALDQYLMGVRAAQDVPPAWYIKSPCCGTPRPRTDIDISDGNCAYQGYATNACTPPETGARTLGGTKTSVTIDQIISAEGQRVPSFSESPRTYRTAWVLIHKPGQVPTQNNTDTLDAVRRYWNRYMYDGSDRRMRSLTALDGRDELGLWDFTLGREGWQGEAVLPADPVSEANALILNAMGGQPMGILHEKLKLRASDARSLKIRAQFSAGTSGSWSFTFAPLGAPVGSGTTLLFPVPKGASAMRELTVDLTRTAAWADTIGSIRLVLATAALPGATVRLDSVELSPDTVRDGDGDAVADSVDNCWLVANDQADTDGDGAGDACDGVVTPVTDAGPPDAGPCFICPGPTTDAGPTITPGPSAEPPRRAVEDGGCSCGSGPSALALWLVPLAWTRLRRRRSS